jgi:tRNA U34 5-carboxymethylaminomethyl modifying GTPase MnmE/TrmE
MYIKLREQQIQDYLHWIKRQKWTDSVENRHGVKHNVVVGNISVGKSSLLNTFFGLKL